MRGPHNVLRLLQTGATLARTGALRVVLDTAGAPPLLSVLARVVSWPLAPFGLKGDTELPPVTRALTALGPAYIKLGQILSTRPDVVGTQMSEQLKYLQDKLPPFDRRTAIETVESELGIKVSEVFSEFSEPIAAASIAQVHRARLHESGEEVAVKILRPGIERAFQRDVDAFHFSAGVIEALLPSTRRLRPTDVIDHFESVVLEELDLRLESSSASKFAENTKNDPDFIVPEVKWAFCSKRVMTLGWGEGIPANDLEQARAAGLDLEKLGNQILQMFLSHALRDGFFHGDMHQGNLKFTRDNKIIALDFGIMGRIDRYTRRVYAEILYGFIRRDYKRVAEVHFEAGYVPANQDMEQFAQALRAVGEPIFGMDATQISMGRLLSYLFEVTEKFGMQTRTELIHLQRTMVVVEGVARSLNPHINIWEVAHPIVEEYIASSIGPRATLADAARTLRVLSRFGPRLPDLVENILIEQANQTPEPRKKNGMKRIGMSIGGLALVAIGFAIGTLL